MSTQLKFPLVNAQTLSFCEMKNYKGGEFITFAAILGIGTLLLTGIGYLGYKSFPGDSAQKENLVPNPHKLPEV